MDFPEFWRRFGGASRRKHLLGLDSIFMDPGSEAENKRDFPLPPQSELPIDFIRLEPWEIEYVFMLAGMATQGIVEIGRFTGGSVFVMSCANDRVPIFSIDNNPRNDELLRTYFVQCGVGSNVRLLVNDSQQRRFPEIAAFDLCFIDGDHSYAGCTNDLERWFPALAPGGHLLLHDSYLGCAVQKALIDFIDRHAVEVIVSPYRGRSHWLTDFGSLCHLRKPRA
jgi:precorrin-6B methylase 2